jgi:protein tyrosine phosphatase
MNANYIFDGQYISCQAPLFSTINDFWRMMWEQNCSVIVMLTRLLEGGKMKANIYWPLSRSCSLRFGDIEVTLLEEEANSEHLIHRHVRLCRGQEVREVHQLHYTEWPDFGAPTSTDGIRDLIAASNAYRDASNNRGPMVVHCSAGIGRSGTFIAIHQAFERIEQGLDFDVKDMVLRMRQERWGMVQTEKQYSFIFRAIDDHLNETEPYFSSSEDEIMTDSPSSLSPRFERSWSNSKTRTWRNTSNNCVPTLQISTETWA